MTGKCLHRDESGLTYYVEIGRTGLVDLVIGFVEKAGFDDAMVVEKENLDEWEAYEHDWR